MNESPNVLQPPREEFAEVEFADIVRFFRRNWRLIFGLAAAAGILTALIVLVFVPRKWEASATLVIVPPKFTSDLKPSTLTVQGYQKLLESDAVIAEARQRLIAKGVLDEDDPLRLEKELETRIFVSRRAEETSLAPMVQAVARGKTAESAAAIANTWAQVFLERVRELMAGSTSVSVQFIEQQYPQARERLAQLEDERVNTVNTYQRRFDEAATRWDEKITAFKNETSQLIAAYKAETRRLLETFSAERNLETRRAQLNAMRKAYGDLQDEQARVAAQLQQKQTQLEAARKQLAATSPVLILQKAITDDALWQSVISSNPKGPDWKALGERTLRTEVPNPVFVEVSTRASQLEMEVNALIPRAAELERELQQMAERLKALDAEIREDDAKLEEMQRKREAGLENLQAVRSLGLEKLTRARQQELDAIKREWETKVGQLERHIAQERDLFADLARNFNQALLAKGQQDVEDVRLGAPAAPPDLPKSRGGAVKSLLAAMLGGLLGIGTALVREAWG